MSTVSQAGQKFPDWQYVRDGLKRNLGQVIRFYRKNPMAVQSSHFLVKLLQSITVPHGMNLERYYDNVDALALHVSMALKMTSSIAKGRVFDGIFYGQGNPEILIAHTESFNIQEAHRNWQNVCAVKVLRHAKSDLGLNLPNGYESGSESGMAVIAINIPMLAIQYRAFRLNEQFITETTGESQRSIYQFIHMYVIPNMLFSHLDVAVFNRLDNLRKGAPLGETTKEHSFYLADFSDKADKALTQILHNLQSGGKDFTNILKNTPLVTKDNLEQLFALPDIAPTQQALWALVIARLPAVAFLFQVLENGPGVSDRHQINKVLREVQRWRTNSLMKNMLPLEEFYTVQDEIDAIVNSST
jgi:hypothetical protein